MKIGSLVRHVETWQIGIITWIVHVGNYTYYSVYLSAEHPNVLLLAAELDIVEVIDGGG